ncbi:MAG TPA: DUF167 domain-containing protein [Pseudomonas sp.]|jgi:uncharacterized protein (TIGR00251 family)|uniref:DUF167 domain-containing protein n=1 Tax=Pseudomonas sp. TaxID=306 RepID=UPI002604F189|nr:DUF167 domain-containing protein [Pseudomonas sp.]HSX91080.1 DUF167 domain-containing protein [Pseudomonas sp.]
MSFYRWDGQDLILECHLQPKASSDAFAGLHGERLKIRLTAPPVDGKANAQLLAFLARAFAVAKSQVSLESGLQSRLKRVRIQQPQRLPEELALTARSP